MIKSATTSQEQNKLVLPASLKTYHVATAVIVLAEVFVLICYFQYLPMTDLPEHMLAAKVITHYHDSDTAYDQFFSKRFPWNPYASYFLFVMGTANVLSVWTATKLYICLSLILTPLMFWWWLRNIAPEHEAQFLPSTLLLFSTFFYMGLVNYLFSLPFFFIGMTISWKLLRGELKSVVAETACAAAVLVTYFSHVVTFGLLIIGVIAEIVLLGRRGRPVRVIRALAPSLVLFAVFLLVRSRQEVASVSWSWDPFFVRVATLLMPFNIFKDPISGGWVYQPELLALWAIVLTLTIIGMLTTRTKKRNEVGPVHGIGLIFLALAVILPSNLAGGLGVSLRSAHLAGFMLVSLLPAAWTQRRTLRWAMALTCVASPILLGIRVNAFQLEMRNLEQAIAIIPAHSRIQPIITEPHSASFRTYPHLHAAAWYNYYKGGVSPYLFAGWALHFPISLHKDLSLKSPGEWNMRQFRYAEHHAGTDFFLVKTKESDILEDLRRNVPFAASFGDWSVFGPVADNRAK